VVDGVLPDHVEQKDATLIGRDHTTRAVSSRAAPPLPVVSVTLVGYTLSTVTVTTADSCTLPATSVLTTRRS
jgi:hypothetical protein